jgi:hypothetical protein
MRTVIASMLLLSIVATPIVGHTHASVRQDSCNVFFDQGKQHTAVWFSVINFSLPAPVCDLHFLSEPHPPTPNCIMVSVGAPGGWTANLVDPGQADWVANSAADCIPAGSFKSGFNFVLDPGFCCYVVRFTDGNGGTLLEQEECFCDNFVGVEQQPWGNIKKLFQ